MRTERLTLPERAYLIGYDVERPAMRGGHEHPQMVSAAVLIELYLAGRLADETGKVRVLTPAAGDPQRGPGPRDTRQRTLPLEPPLLALLARIEESKPRPWKHWVNEDAKGTYRAVREALARDRVIRIQERRLLGIPVPARVTVRDTRIVRRQVTQCRRAVLTGIPVARVDAADAALVALAAATELGTVFSGAERRAHRERIAVLAQRCGPAARALRDIVEGNRSAG